VTLLSGSQEVHLVYRKTPAATICKHSPLRHLARLPVAPGHRPDELKVVVVVAGAAAASAHK